MGSWLPKNAPATPVATGWRPSPWAPGAVETLTMGSRGRPVIIAGFLRGASRAVVSALILAIEEQIRDVDYATLIDGDSNSYNYVALDSFVQRGPYKYTADGAVLCQYEVRGRQLV